MSEACANSIGSAANSIGDSVSMDLRRLAEPWLRGEKVQIAIGRAAKLTGLPYWRAWNIWFRKARTIKPEEREAIAQALEDKHDAELRAELQNLRIRLARLECVLAQAPTVGRAKANAARPMG